MKRLEWNEIGNGFDTPFEWETIRIWTEEWEEMAEKWDQWDGKILVITCMATIPMNLLVHWGEELWNDWKG